MGGGGWFVGPAGSSPFDVRLARLWIASVIRQRKPTDGDQGRGEKRRPGRSVVLGHADLGGEGGFDHRCDCPARKARALLVQQGHGILEGKPLDGGSLEHFHTESKVGLLSRCDQPADPEEVGAFLRAGCHQACQMGQLGCLAWVSPELSAICATAARSGPWLAGPLVRRSGWIRSGASGEMPLVGAIGSR